LYLVKSDPIFADHQTQNWGTDQIGRAGIWGPSLSHNNYGTTSTEQMTAQHIIV
jgi:hypothetical protein